MMEIGRVREIVRYPVKSMAGTATESAVLGWHGLAGDRRFAFRRLGVDNGFPWLSASRLAELVLYHPVGLDESTGEPLPTQIRTPDGALQGYERDEGGCPSQRELRRRLRKRGANRHDPGWRSSEPRRGEWLI